MAQAEQLKQQTLATLTERDQQLRQLTAMLEEAQAQRPKLKKEHYQREVESNYLSLRLAGELLWDTSTIQM